jgi:cell division septal protein FtsQ
MSAEPIHRPDGTVARRTAAKVDGIAPSLHPGGGAEEIAHYRRRDIVTRHRRPGAARLAQRLAVVLLLVATPALVVWWLLTSPSFALREVRVVAADSHGASGASGASAVSSVPRIPAGFVEDRLNPVLGRNLFRLSLEEVRRRLEHPWVAGVAVGKEPPGALRVTVLERQPVALVGTAEGLWYLDAAGAVIAPCCVEGEAVPPMLHIGGALRGPRDVVGALRVVAEVRRLDAPWSNALERVTVLGVDNYRLEFSALPFALLVRTGSLEGKVEHLTLLFPELVARYQSIEAVDLRFRQRVVVRPVEAGEPSGESPRTALPSGPDRPADRG